MNQPVNPELLSRRELLNAGLLLTGATLLTGCQSAPRSSSGGGVVNLPPGVWPDPKNVADATIKPPPAPPVTGGLPEGVIPRSRWTSAKPNFRVSKPMNGITRITVHHSAINSTSLTSERAVIDHLERIRRNHVARTDERTGAHWVDIGYHFIIDPAGRIWEGRPTSIEGAHVSRANDHNLGVVLLGNFSEHRPTSAALDSLDRFVASQMRFYRVPPQRVYTHRELRTTECPGRWLQAYMNSTRQSSGRLVQLALA
jgi:hypothetical protein